MNKFITFFYGSLTACVMVIIFSLALQGCEPKPIPLGGIPDNAPRASVEQDYKLYTDNDLKALEVPDEELNYLNPNQGDGITGYLPDNLTAEDIALIRQHNETQLRKMEARR